MLIGQFYGQNQFLRIKKKRVIIFKLDSHLYKRFINLMKEDEIPPLPTREQELQYLDFLEKSIAEDKFFTIHPRLYSAGPNRLRFKAMKEMRHEYRMVFLKNMITSALILLPINILYKSIT